jgi:A/G-specific adenine glycosylase
MAPSASSSAWRTRLRRALLAWYRQAARDLPWRRDPSPYRVWLSEIMLQQTQVAAVHDHFTRFIARFPSIAALAAAPEAEVLAAWQGLGYYRRARQLKAAAQVVMERHRGSFPLVLADALALPGVGRYTAGAVLSIAHDQPHPVVDGNVARVLARLLALTGAPESARVKARLWAAAQDLVPRRDPGAWNQALMELGALICTPRRPDCPACPVASLCAARAAGRVDSIPPPRRRRRPPLVEVAAAWIDRGGGRLGVVQRPGRGVLAGFWELPQADVGTGADARAELGAALARLGAKQVVVREALARVEHSMFNRRAKLTAYATRASWGRESALRVASPAELAHRPLTTASRKLIRAVGREAEDLGEVGGRAPRALRLARA